MTVPPIAFYGRDPEEQDREVTEFLKLRQRFLDDIWTQMRRFGQLQEASQNLINPASSTPTFALPPQQAPSPEAPTFTLPQQQVTRVEGAPPEHDLTSARDLMSQFRLPSSEGGSEQFFREHLEAGQDAPRNFRTTDDPSTVRNIGRVIAGGLVSVPEGYVGTIDMLQRSVNKFFDFVLGVDTSFNPDTLREIGWTEEDIALLSRLRGRNLVLDEIRSFKDGIKQGLPEEWELPWNASSIVGQLAGSLPVAASVYRVTGLIPGLGGTGATLTQTLGKGLARGAITDAILDYGEEIPWLPTEDMSTTEQIFGTKLGRMGVGAAVGMLFDGLAWKLNNSRATRVYDQPPAGRPNPLDDIPFADYEIIDDFAGPMGSQSMGQNLLPVVRVSDDGGAAPGAAGRPVGPDRGPSGPSTPPAGPAPSPRQSLFGVVEPTLSAPTAAPSASVPNAPDTFLGRVIGPSLEAQLNATDEIFPIRPEPVDLDALKPFELPATKLAKMAGTIRLDENGEPIRYYRGVGFTQHDFDVSKTNPHGLAGPGIYVTSHPSVAGGDPSKINNARTFEEALGQSGVGYALERAVEIESSRMYNQERLLELEAYNRNLREEIAEIKQEIIDQGFGPGNPYESLLRTLETRLEYNEDELEGARAELSKTPEPNANVMPLYVAVKQIYDFDEPLSQDSFDRLMSGLEQTDIIPSEHLADMVEHLRGVRDASPQMKGIEFYHSIENYLSALQNSPTAEKIFAEHPDLLALHPRELIRRILIDAGFDAIRVDGGARTGLPFRHEALTILDPRNVIPAFANEETIAGQAAALGIKWTKQQQVLNSPLAPELAAKPGEIDDIDVASAALATSPGGTSVIRGVDPAVVEKLPPPGQGMFWHLIPHGDRTDLIVSMFAPLSEEAQQMYAEYGVFPGMRIISVASGNAKEGVVQGLAKSKAGNTLIAWGPPQAKIIVKDGKVRNRSHATKPENIRPLTTSPNFIESDAFLADFDSMVVAELGKIGLSPSVESYLSEPGQEAMVRAFEATIKAHDIRDPAFVDALRGAADLHLLAQYQRMEPEASAFHAQMKDEAEAAEAATDPDDVATIPDLAAGSGWNATILPNGSWIIQSELSGDMFTFPNEEAARDFLQTAEQRVPELEVDPNLPTPDILADGNPTKDSRTRSDEAVSAAADTESLLRVEQEAAEEQAQTIGGAPLLEDVFDGGAGDLPPAGDPPRIGGGGPVPPLSDLHRAASLAGHLDPVVTGFYWRMIAPFRYFTDKVDEIFSEEMGLPNFKISAMQDELSRQITIAHNHAYPIHNKMTEAFDSISDFRLIRDGKVWDVWALENPQAREALAQSYGFTERDREAIRKLDEAFEELHDPKDLAFTRRDLIDFVGRARTAQLRGVGNPYPDAKEYPSIAFYAINAKERHVDFRHPNITAILESYTKAYTFAKHAGQTYADMRKFWSRLGAYTDQLGKRPLQPVAQIFMDWLDLIRRGYEPAGRDMMISAVRSLFRMIGVPLTNREASTFINGGIGITHRSFLGFRLHTVLRDSMQPVLALPWVGPKHLTSTMKDVLVGGNKRISAAQMSRLEEIMNRAFDAGTIQLGMPKLEVSWESEQGGLEATDVRRSFTPKEIARRELIANIRGHIRNLTPRWLRTISGGKLDPLWLYTRSNMWTRVITGEAAHRKFEEAWNRYQAEGRTIDWLVQEVGAGAFTRAKERRFRELVALSKDEADKFYMNTVTNDTMFRYGSTEIAYGTRTHGMRAGWQFGNFTREFTDLVRRVAKSRDRRFKLRWMLYIGGVTYGLHKLEAETKWPMRRWAFSGAFGYSGGPAVSAAVGAWEAFQSALALGEEYETPMDRARTEAPLSPEFWGSVANNFNPARGMFETISNVGHATNSFDPVEATFRTLITGDRRGEGTDWRQHFNQSLDGLGGGGGAF